MQQPPSTANSNRVAESLNHLFVLEVVAAISRTTKTEDGGESEELEVNTKLETMGYDVGYKFLERAAQHRLIPSEPLEAIKFICKDLWQDIFGKAVDKLQTNHRGVFVLKDFAFKWISRHSTKSDVDVKKTQARLLRFPCGVLRGALANLGFTAVVTADVEPSDTAQVTSFHIRMS